MFFRALFFLSFVTLSLLAPVSFKHLTQGVKLAKTQLDLPQHPEWDVELKEEVAALCNQPFTYLDRGTQCYVFLSSDEKCVLKIFRYDQGKNLASTREKAVRLFKGCHLAYREVREETGLLYIHLNPTEGIFPKIKIRAPLGKTYTIPLDKYRFVLQKKAETLGAVFQEAYAKRDLERGKLALQSLISLVNKRTSLGIRNLDSNLSRNFGLIGQHAIEIDFGNYIEDPKGKAVEMELLFSRLSRWFAKSFPEWSYLIDEERAR